jgi:hypothetical protein
MMRRELTGGEKAGEKYQKCGSAKQSSKYKKQEITLLLSTIDFSSIYDCFKPVTFL